MPLTSRIENGRDLGELGLILSPGVQGGKSYPEGTYRPFRAPGWNQVLLSWGHTSCSRKQKDYAGPVGLLVCSSTWASPGLQSQFSTSLHCWKSLSASPRLEGKSWPCCSACVSVFILPPRPEQQLYWPVGVPRLPGSLGPPNSHRCCWLCLVHLLPLGLQDWLWPFFL